MLERAGHRCEYCRLSVEDSPLAALQVEHIIPRKHGGDDSPSNLACACIACNLCKGSDLTGVDPATGAVTRLYDLRQQSWEQHFRCDGIYIRDVTDVGRTTVRVLRMNSEDRLLVRVASREFPEQ
jgi:hypothetical protein